ncbi:type I restriction endonuclease [Sphaerotilus uruguayifluvii]|uniref:type I site-specific deoxyribonuclease n=1 Tax=Sphaerotilus uruguayifluvii TaxID=2735897 RepID=A0ABX2G309_9BURK|nr:type I site-specific restriction-modification system R (restriction) subunit [Leptothrix sp. C29]
MYELLRYGVKVRPDAGEQTRDVWLIDWKHPERNHFGIAEEVTVKPHDPRAHTKRPDLVLYVNGIALAMIELKRSTVSVSEGIRQNLDNQKPKFIEGFFSTLQFVMAGSDTEGLRDSTIGTPERHYLTWREDGPDLVRVLDAARPSPRGGRWTRGTRPQLLNRRGKAGTGRAGPGASLSRRRR